MAKFELPIDGQDPNDPKSKVGNSEVPEDGFNEKKTVSQKAQSAAQGTVSDTGKATVKAIKKNGANVGKVATEVGAGAAGSAAKNVAKEVVDEETAEKVEEVVKKGGAIAGAGVMVKGVVAGVSQALSAIVALVVDPITWIVVAVILLIIIIVIGFLAGLQVFGKTENADGCYGIGMNGGTSAGGSVSIDVKASEDTMANATTIADWAMTTNFAALGNKPMTREQVAGLIGNMWQESTVNPGASQNTGAIPKDASNSSVMALGKANGGKAIGLIQWDSDRRFYLAQYAESKGKPWSDLGVQLEFLQQEIDGTVNYPGATYNRDQVLKKGFGDAGKDIAHYTEAWEKGFTRAGKPMLSNRIDYANTFNSGYKPGSGAGFSASSSGGSCLTGGSSAGSVDTTDTVDLAIQISYSTTTESKTGGDQMGTSKAKPEYIAAKDKAQEIGSKDGLPGLYASCDRAVATVVINTMDKSFPWGNIVTQRKYMDSNPDKWKRYTSVSEAKPGDVWVTQPSSDGGGHVMMFLGNVNGRDMIMHASYSSRGNSRVAGLQVRSDYVSDAMVDKGGRSYYGYTYIGG